jgi:hypothetical protein
MLRLRHLLPALLVPVAAGTAVAGGLTAGKAPVPMSCEIRVSDTPLGWQVEPVALASMPLAGDYQFTVAKVSKGGTAVSSQSGDFEALAGLPTVLSTAVFDRKGSIDAELTVRWSGGAVSCTRRFPGA